MGCERDELVGIIRDAVDNEFKKGIDRMRHEKRFAESMSRQWDETAKNLGKKIAALTTQEKQDD